MTADRRLRVLVIGPDPSPDAGAVGPNRFLATMLEALAGRAEVEASVLTFVREARPPPASDAPAPVIRIAEPRVASTLLLPVSARRSVEDVMRRVQPDVVDLHEPERAAVLGPSGVPVVATVHARLPELLRAGAMSRWKRPLLPFVERSWLRGLRRARTVVALSEADASELRGHGARHVVVQRVPRAPHWFDRPRVDAARRPPYVVCVGTIGTRKNQLAAVRAFARVAAPRARLRVIGGTEGADGERALAAARAEADRLGIARRVEFTGAMSLEGVAAEMRDASVALTLSRQESAPAAIVEAMASGAPVVASRIPAHTELIEHRSTGVLVDADDVDGVAAAIEELLHSPELRGRISECAFERARRRHDADAFSEERIRLWREAASW